MSWTGVNNVAGQKPDPGFGGQIVLDLAACCRMERGDKWFELLLATRLLLELAKERSLELTLRKAVKRAVERTEFVVSQVCLVQEGDL
jgi:hypothetical protein